MKCFDMGYLGAHSFAKKWLAEDFQRERQRHIGNAKKVTKAVENFHKTKDARKLKKSKVLNCGS